MLKEGAYAEEEAEESIERKTNFRKEFLKRLVESREMPTDSGRSGLLFRIDNEELSPEDQKMMAETEGDENREGSLSIKALKIFSVAKARQEFSALQEARDIILKDRVSSSTPLARVPRAFGYDEIEVDESTQERLNKNGASITDGKVAVIIMDWIEGKDLGAVLYEELLKRSPDDEDVYQSEVWDNPKFEELLRALEKKGFVLPKEILAQLENAIAAMHAKNFYHNDLHLRNLILKDARLEDPEIYMIDFADASHGRKNIEETEGEFFLSDENILKSLKPLTMTREDKEKERRAVIIKEWNDRIATLEQHPKLQKQYESLEALLKANNANMLEGQLIASSGNDSDLENFLGNLLKLSRQNEGYRNRVYAFLQAHTSEKKSTLRSFVINRMQSLQSAIEI